MTVKHTAPMLSGKRSQLALKRREPTEEERLSRVDPSQRILLLSHCLRSSAFCKAKIEAWGLACVECTPSCQVNRLRKVALDYGYKAVCVAPGGSMALKFIADNDPRGIVAVACRKELKEGIASVKKLIHGKNKKAPPIVIIPLTKDGCVNTEVNLKLAIAKITLGCSQGDEESA
jgi:hypothetical protein